MCVSYLSVLRREGPVAIIVVLSALVCPVATAAALDLDAPFEQWLRYAKNEENAPDLPFTLTVSSPKTTLLPNEPLVLDWRLSYAGSESIRINKPEVMVHITEPGGSGYNLREMTHFMTSQPPPVQVDPGYLHASGMLMQTAARRGVPPVVVPFSRPGVYEVRCAFGPIVTDPDRAKGSRRGKLIRSNVLTVTVVSAKGRDADASALYRTVQLGTYSPKEATREEAAAAAERLATEFGDTVFGLYERLPRIAVAGRWGVHAAGYADTRAVEHTRAQAQQSRVEMLEAFVRDAEAADFPLLDSAMQQLAGAYLSAHMEAEAQEICDTMRKRFPDSHHTEYVERLLRGDEEPPVP